MIRTSFPIVIGSAALIQPAAAIAGELNAQLARARSVNCLIAASTSTQVVAVSRQGTTPGGAILPESAPGVNGECQP